MSDGFRHWDINQILFCTPTLVVKTSLIRLRKIGQDPKQSFFLGGKQTKMMEYNEYIQCLGFLRSLRIFFKKRQRALVLR